MMWPSALDMTRDECRGVLRRLELETYSSVVSTFRAQGGLNDVKIKILEDLRNVFHISTDRHRAEARRVANDEQLGTIAETVSGPNTTQEWSREGRRSFPMLPRAAPYTALSSVANGVAEAVKNENAKLPYPAETVRVANPISPEPSQEAKQIVKQDPGVLSADEKRNLKRAHQIPESAILNTPLNKKRTFSGENAQLQTQLHTNTKIQQLYHNHSKTQSRHKKAVPKRNAGIQKSKATTVTQPKIQPTPKNAKNAEMPVSATKMCLPIPRNLHTYASMPQQNAQHESFSIAEKPIKLNAESPEIVSSGNWPQIATSKKDITNNLSKLNMIAGSPIQAANTIDVNKVDGSLSPHLYNVDGRTSVNNSVASTALAWTPKSQTVITASQRAPLKPTPVASAMKQTSKQLQHSQHLPSQPNAITYGSGFINVNQKTAKPETLQLVTANDRKELDITSANVLSIGSLARLDSTSSSEGSSKSPLVVSGNYDIKTNLENSSPTFLTSTGVKKPKIQIHSNQTISPAFGNIKIPPGMQLKGVVPARKSVQIFSSTSGKMFIQSAENPKAIGQLGTVVSQKNILSGLSASGNPTTPISGSVPGANRYALQKVQIVPSGTATKSINVNKSDVIFMPGNVVSTAPSSGNIVVRSIPIVKQSKRLTIQGTNRTAGSELANSNLAKNQNNVIVIGAVPTEKNIKEESFKLSDKNISETSMITEDTPVDILTTPITSLDNSLHITQTPKEVQKFEIKASPVTVLQTITATSNDDPNKKYQLHADVGTIGKHKRQHLQATSQIITGENIESMDSENNYIISTTDWEVELDQQASKNRNDSEVIMREQHIEHDSDGADDDCKDGNSSSLNIIDNFHDVIEEDIIDDESIINEGTEEDVEFDVSYGSIQDDMTDNVAIEYVEETGFSSDVMADEYGDADGNIKNHTTKIIPVSQTQTLIYSTNNTDSTANGKTSVTSLDSSTLMFEIDENGVNQMRNVTLSELLTSQASKTADKSINLTNIKRISD